MSTIDERVVEMRFDNEQFQKGIEESIESLDSLKESLDLDEATKSLEKLEKAGEDFSLDSVTKAVDEVQNKFNALEAIAFGAFANIGAQAANAGLKIAKAFTVDQIFSGKGKYELKTQSVQAIKAALPDTDLSEIMEQLEDLNKYTDETSYDFSQMVATIGKFTANGIKLKESVEAMKGIGNEAAKSGANIQEANRAMYNFAQALSSGSVKYVDWKSIELANMGTKEFKQTIIDTAVELGTLKKAGDKIRTKKGTLVNFQNFASTLHEEWFTSDVLVKTLNKYADVTTDFGLDAFHAAQQALTFTQAMQAIADAASTGWARTFELLFGQLDEAIDFFTGFCNQVIGVINAFDESRNNLITAWRGQDILDENGKIAEEIDNEIDGRTKLLEGLNDALWGLYAIAESVKAAFVDIFPSSINDKTNTLIDLTTKFADAMHNFRETLVNDIVVNSLSDDDALFLSDLIGLPKEAFSDKNNKKVIKNAVELVQVLQKMGYLGEDASKIAADVARNGFTDALSEKLKLLQKDLGITESGVYDLNTAILLTEKYTKELSEENEDILPFLDLKRNGKKLNEVKELQQVLTDLEYDLGSVDGIFGKKTEAAVKKFQKDMGLAETGIVDVQTAIALYRKTVKKDGGIAAEFDYYGGTKTFDNLKRVFKPLAAAIKVILAAMKAVIKTGAGVARSILKAFGPVLDVLAVIGDGISAALTWFADSGILDFISDWFLSTAGFTADLVRYGAEAIKWIFGFGGAAKSEDGKIHNFAQLIGYIVEKVKAFDIFGKISAHLETFKGKLASTTGKLSEWFATFKTNMDEKWQERFDTIVAGIDEFFAVFNGSEAEAAAENGERATTWITGFANAIQTVFETTETVFRRAGDMFGEFLVAFSGESDRLQYRVGLEPWWVKLGLAAKTLSEWINSTVGKISAKWTLFLYALRGDTRASEKSPWYVTFGTQIHDVFDWIDKTIDKIQPKWQEFFSAFKGDTEITEDSPWYVKAIKTVWSIFDWIEKKGRVVTDIWNGFLLGLSGNANRKYRGEKPWYVTTGETVKKIFDWIHEKIEPITTAWDEFILSFSSDSTPPEGQIPWYISIGYAIQDAWGWVLEKYEAIRDAITEIKRSVFGGEYKADEFDAETFNNLSQEEKNRLAMDTFGDLFAPQSDGTKNENEWWYSLLEKTFGLAKQLGDTIENIKPAWDGFLSALRGETEVNEDSPWYVKLGKNIRKIFDWIDKKAESIRLKWHMFLRAFTGKSVPNEKSPWYVKLGGKLHTLFDTINKNSGKIGKKWEEFLIAFRGDSDRLQYRKGKEPWWVALGLKLKSFVDFIKREVNEIKTIGLGNAIANNFDMERLSELPKKLDVVFKTIKQKIVDFFKSLPDTLKTGAILGLVGIGIAFAALLTNFLFDLYQKIMLLSEIPKILTDKLKPQQLSVQSMGVMLLEIASSILIIAYAIKMVGSLDDSSFFKGIAFFALSMAALVGIFVAFQKLQRTSSLVDSFKSILSIGALVMTILPLAAAILILGRMDGTQLLQGFGVLLVIFGSIYGLNKLLNKTDVSVNVSLKGFIELAGAIGILAMAVIVLGLIPPAVLSRGIKAVAWIAAIIAGMMIVVGLFNKWDAGIKSMPDGLIRLALSITIISAVVILLGIIPQEVLNRGYYNLTVIMVMLGTFVGVNRFISMMAGGTNNSLDGFIKLAGAISILALAVVMLGVIPESVLKRGLLTLGSIIGILTVYQLLTKKANFSLGNASWTSLLALAMVIISLAEAFTMIEKIDIDKIEAFAAGLAKILKAFSLIASEKSMMFELGETLAVFGKQILGSSGSYKFGTGTKALDIKQAAGVLLEMGGLAAAMVSLGYALKFIENVKPESIIAFGSIMVALLGTLVVLNKFGNGLTITGSAKLGVAVGAFVDIVTALVLAMVTLVGHIEEATNGGFVRRINRAGEVLDAIGKALGKFIGAFKDAAKASEGFDSTGMTVLATIIGVLSPVIVPLLAVGGAFLELIGTLNHLTKGGDAALIKKSADVLYSIGYAIGSFIGGIQDGMQTRNLEQRVEEIKMIGQAMAEFADATKDIDLDVFDRVVEAFKKLVEVAKSIPKQGGWIQKIGGTIDFGDFAESLKTFSEGLSSFVATCKTISAYKGTIFSNGEEPKGDGDLVLDVAKEIADFFDQLELYDIKFTGNGGYISAPGLLAGDIELFSGAVDTFVKKSEGLGARKDEVEASATVATEIGDILYNFFVKIGSEDDTTWDGQGNVYSTYLPTVQSLCISIDLFSASLGTLLMAVTGVNSRAKQIEDDVKASTGIMDQMREWFSVVEEETTIENGFPSYTTAVDGVCRDVTTFSESINTLIADLSGMQSVIDGSGKVKGEKNTPTLREKVTEATTSVGLIQTFLNDIAGYTITDAEIKGNDSKTLSFYGLDKYTTEITAMYDKVREFGNTFGEFAENLKGTSDPDDDLRKNTSAAIESALMVMNFLNFFNPNYTNWSSKSFGGSTDVSDEDRKALLSFIKNGMEDDSIKGIDEFKSYFTAITGSVTDFGADMKLFYDSVSGIQIGDKDTGFVAKTKTIITAATEVLTFLTQFASDSDIVEPIMGTKYFQYKESYDSNTWDFFTYMDGLSDSISNFYNKNKDWSGTAISERVSDAITACKNILETASLIVNDTYADPDDILPEGKFSASSITEFTRFLGVFETLGSSLHTFMVSSDNFDTDEFTSVSRSITSLVIALNKLASLTSEGFMDKFDEVAVSERIKTVASTLKTGADEGAATISGGTEEMQTAGNSLMASLSSGFENSEGATNIVSSASTIVGKVIKSMDGHADEASLIGKNLTIGLRLGLTDSTTTNALYQSAKNIIEKALTTMNEAADSHSPSRKTTKLGMYLDTGLIKGLKDYSGLVSKTAGGVSDDAIDAIRRTMTGVSNLIDSDISLDPVIRPVVDMSNVTSSSNAIDSMLSANRTVKLNTSRVASTFNRTAGIQNGSGSTSTSFANDSSVNITGNQFVIRNEQDIRSLAHEIASYTNQQQRNLGLSTR